MKIIYETNSKGVLGWIVEYPGAYVRGKTVDEARNKIEHEVQDYCNWLEISGIAYNKIGRFWKSCGMIV